MAELTADDYRQLETRLKKYVRKRVSNDDEVDDLVQDIFVKAARTWQGCEAPLNLVAWLFTAARTTIIDHYRKKRLPIWEGELEALPSPDTDDGSWDDLSACLVPFIKKMDDKYRDVLMATDIAGARMQSAADQLGLTLPALKSRVRRGRHQLKSALLKCCTIESANNRMRDSSVRSPCNCDGC